jgi:hypothetical protein
VRITTLRHTTAINFGEVREGVGSIEVWEGGEDPAHLFVIDKLNVEQWRSIFSQGLGMCEAVDPKGYQVTMPEGAK